MHTSLHALVVWCTQRGLVCSLNSIDTFISLICPYLADIWACAHKHKACMHASLCAGVKLCAHTGLSCSHSIDTFISLIQSNLADIWACAHKHIGCMHASLHARVDLRAQKDPACYPDSIDILISLIRSNLAEIWACACKHIGCMHTSLRAQVYLCAQKDRLVILIPFILWSLWSDPIWLRYGPVHART